MLNTTSLYWDCECEKGYIHPKAESNCYLCGCQSDDQPDSRVEEVELAGFSFNVEGYKYYYLQFDTHTAPDVYGPYTSEEERAASDNQPDWDYESWSLTVDSNGEIGLYAIKPDFKDKEE